MRAVIVGWAVVLAGCNQETRPTNGSEQQKPISKEEIGEAGTKRPLKSDLTETKDLKVQVPLGDGSAENWGRIRFKITKVYERQDFTKAPPYHRNGGKWTFFDCEIAKGARVSFTVGVCPRGEAKGPIAWGRAVIAVTGRQAGSRFIDLFAKAFHAAPPRARPSDIPLEPLVMSTAILGEDLKQDPGGGFAGTGGGWTATKWFPQQNGLEAEVFFDYNVRSQVGEFNEKDTEYRQDLLAILATALRDGPRPDRTPDIDNNLVSVGPRIDEVCCLLPRRPSYCSFSPGGNYVVYQDVSAIFAVDPSQPDRPKELARFEKPICSIHLLDKELRLLVCESLPTLETGMSFDGPRRLWWVEPGSKGKQLLLGPEKDISFGNPPVSPDARYLAIERWKERIGQRGRYTAVTFLDRQSGSTKVAELQNESLNVAGWRGNGSELRAVLIANRWKIDKNRPERIYLADPATGKLVLGMDVSVPDNETRPVSPDGKHRVEIEGKERLVVVNLATNEKRVFNFHEDDFPFVGEGCVKWAGSRYLQFNAGRLSVIDINSMKMSYPTPRPAPGTSASYTFSPDFRWMLCQREEGEKAGLFLGRVVVHADGAQGK